jgi:hypothetical protein
MLASIVGQGRGWTVLIATGRQLVIERCDRAETMDPNVAQAENDGDDFSG